MELMFICAPVLPSDSINQLGKTCPALKKASAKLYGARTWACNTSINSTDTSQKQIGIQTEAEKQVAVIKVCGNITCKKQGSILTRTEFQALLQQSSPNIRVESCGCFGRCGEGPNVNVIVGGYSRKITEGVRNLDTILECIQFLQTDSTKLPELDNRLVEAIRGHEKAKKEAESDQTKSAIESYNQVIDLLDQCIQSIQPPITKEDILKSGVNELRARMLCNRAVLLIETNQKELALQDVNKAVDEFPQLARAWNLKAQAHAMENDAEFSAMCVNMAAKLDKEEGVKAKKATEQILAKFKKWW